MNTLLKLAIGSLVLVACVVTYATPTQKIVVVPPNVNFTVNSKVIVYIKEVCIDEEAYLVTIYNGHATMIPKVRGRSFYASCK